MSSLHSYTRRFLTRTTIAFILFLLFALSFVALADEVHEKSTTQLDEEILRTINSYATTGADTVFLWLTHLGGALFLAVITTFICVVLWRKGSTAKAMVLGASVLGATLINLVVKQLFERSRPDLWTQLVNEHSFSFPSGHAMASSALTFGLIAITWNSKYRWLVVTLGGLYTLVVGFSRLYLGVHYPTDVLGGWLLSATWVSVVWLLWKTRKQNTPTLGKGIAKPKQ